MANPTQVASPDVVMRALARLIDDQINSAVKRTIERDDIADLKAVQLPDG
ncbi:hypothetical protein PTKU46_74980 [Paraburkholderia terrae]